MGESILDRILQTKREEVATLKAQVGLAELRRRAEAAPRARNFFSAVSRRPRRLVNLIAEVKRASQSAGVIRGDFDPVAIARDYEAAGADALSVLTDRQYFQGSLEILQRVRGAVELPILRKDFIIDEHQVYETRASGADAILLIAAALPEGRLTDLAILATELRLTCLIEVHDADELLRVRPVLGFPHAGYGVLGINNRDLKTFTVDVGTTVRLAEMAPKDVPVVSESGIRTRGDVERLRRAGVSAVLVGETLMRSGDVAATVEELLGDPS